MKHQCLLVEKNLDKKFIKMYTVTYNTGDSTKDYYFVSRHEMEDLAIVNEEPKATAVEVFAYYKDKIIMIEEFRNAVNKRCLSFCAGLIEKGETWQKAVEREVYEELGGKVKSMEALQDYPMLICAGLTDEANYLVVCELESIGKQHLERAEDIEVKMFGVDELEQKMKNNELKLTASGLLGAIVLINKLKNRS